MSRTHLPLTTEHALLGFLRRQPRHGYEIYQKLAAPTGLGLVWRLKQSQMYALLAKLEQAGYVVATLEPQDARPPRKVFALTPAGQQAFLAWLEQPVPRGHRLRLDFLAKLYFARLEGPAVAQRLIERQHAACRQWRVQQRREADKLRQTHPYDSLVYEFRLGQIEAMLAWLDICAEALPHAAPEP
jgi:DNA-binding PadR family transcriptional regulator